MNKSPVIFTLRNSFIFSVLLSISSTSWSQQNMTMMQKAQYTSPMPSLMMLVQNNADVLELDNEQLDTVREWRHRNHMVSKTLMKEILDLEAEIKTDVLDGYSEDEMEEMKQKLLEARGKLIDLKYQCISTMQKTLDKDQWQKLMEIRDKQMRITSNKSGTNEIQAFLRVSPMPKFMAVILMHSAELKLTPEQHKALENWRLKNMNHWASLFDQVLTEEKAITEDSLMMKSSDELMKRFEDVIEKRREMAQMSLACRDNMRKVLSEQQWQQVVTKLNSYR